MPIAEGAPYLFWICTGLTLYTYCGYPLLAKLLSRLRPKPVKKQPIQPSVSLIIAAYNEEKTIREKLINSLALEYPRRKLDIVVAAYGSSDRTVEIAREFAAQGVRVFHRNEREGKTSALNRVVQETTSDILFFSDANTYYDPSTISTIVSNFADPTIGGVSGRKVVLEDRKRESTQGETAYWSYEASLKCSESLIGSIATADGEIFAVRRNLFDVMPRSVVHDDMYLTLKIVEKGFRVVYEPDALSAEYASRTLWDEFHLKVRYASAGYDIVRRFHSMLLPPRTWFALEFLSHKICRWLAPFFLIGAFLASAFAPGIAYRLMFLAQLLFYIAAFIGWCIPRSNDLAKVFYFPLYFSVMNTAALYGFARYFISGQTPLWRKAER